MGLFTGMTRASALAALITLAALATAVRFTTPPEQAGHTLFRDVRVFDGENVVPRTDVLVSGGVIAAMGSNLTAPAGAVVIAANGGTLLPGLIDAHTHVFQDALEEALVFGVTTELDMFTDVRMLSALRREQETGEAHGRADIFSAGTMVTAPGGHGTQFGMPIPTLTHADSADAFVAARVEEGSDWIKVVYDDGHAHRLDFPTLDRPTLAAVIAAAHRRDMRAVVHVSTADAALHALEAGADGLVHVFIDRPLDDRIMALARERGAFVIPTLVVIRGITGTGGAAGLVDDAHLAPYLGPPSRASLTSAYPARPDAARQYGYAADATRRLHEAGVPILAGSDAPNPGTSHGAALHRELELLVEAGLTPLDALRAATSAPAKAFGLADRGRIAPGLRADLLLIDGDPTTDIRATRAIRGVWKGGVALDRAAWAARTSAAVARATMSAADVGVALARGLIADFEDGALAAAFGTEWMPSTDAMIGGSSTVQINVVRGGAGGSAHSLHLSGTVDGRLPNAWAGIMWSPGAQPMMPLDLSSRAGLRFTARGDGRSYGLMIFAQSRGMTPILHTFTAGESWQEVSVPWSAFGVDGSDVMAVLFVATPPAGNFSIQVDDVRLF